MCWQPDVQAHEEYLDKLMKSYFDGFMEYADEMIDFGYQGDWDDATTMNEVIDDVRRRVTKLLKNRHSGYVKSSVVDRLTTITVDWKRMLGLDL